MASRGVQEYEEDGRLICLSCGRSFALLAPHLARAHEMSSAEYRELYELPRRLSLRAATLTERAREQGRARYRQRSDIREAMERGRTNAPDTSAIPSSQETAMRPMVRAARKRGGQGHAEAARRRMEERIARVGFASLSEYFQARAETSDSAMARELGVSRMTVAAWRKRAQEA